MTKRRFWLLAAAAPIALLAHCGGDDSTGATPTDDGGGADGTTVGDGQSPSDGSRLLPDGGIASAKTVGSYVGVNGFIDDPIADLAPIGIVREYHNWGWIADNFAASPAYPDLRYTFMNFNGWDWDVYFAALVDAGVSGFPAVQGSVPWLAASAVPPVAAGADAGASVSYVAHADAMFQIAARYGSTKVDDSKLRLSTSPAQTHVSGLGTVQYFEDFNEEDNAAAFTPAAMAAMASADEDGDQGRMGASFGVKQADPNAKLVMGGLSGKYPPGNVWLTSITDYLDGMQAWANTHRGGDFPADVINVHYYSFPIAGPGTTGPALSPEADHVKDKLADVIAYRDAHLPGKPVWWTEFGYDSDKDSSLGAPQLKGNSPMIVQAQWLVRDLLAGLAAGIDRATLFELDDTGPVAAGTFVTCGLKTAPKPGTRKPSWYFVATFRARLATMTYVGEQTSGDPNVMIYEFRDTISGGGALVIWAPTSDATVVAGYTLSLPNGAKTAKSVTLADQQQNGVEAPLTVAAGKVTLDVSETPTIVLVDAM
ncbi:MAG: hypothetical protein ABI461_14025 [Polyangiaceae bacterium]